MENGDFYFESISLLMTKLHKKMQREFRTVLGAYGLSSMHAVYFKTLQRNGGFSQKQLTDRLHCDKANTSRAINELIEKGYVYKDLTSDNERNMRLYLSPAGALIANELESAITSIKNKIASCLTDEEKQTFRNMIIKINDLDLNK